MAAGVRQPPTRAFMDDLTITAKTVIEGRWMLEDLEKRVTWARMKFKPAKSRSLVLKNGKVSDRYKFKIRGEVIPTVSEKPIKSLGKVFDSSLSDKESINAMKDQAKTMMEKVDRSGLPGKFKAWCYQHGVLPRLLWPLLVYEVPLSSVEMLERLVSSYLRRWLGVPRNFTSIGLYGKQNKLQLPLKGITEEYKATKVRQVMMLKDSKDNKISEAGLKVRTGRKWKAGEAAEEAESRLRHKDLIGAVAVGRQGLGMTPSTSWGKAGTKERRQLVQDEVRKKVEEERQARAVGMKQQGAWMRWEATQDRRVTWQDIWKAEGSRLSFLLRAVYDVLPSPANLHTWGIAENPACKLCGRRGSLEHILSSCQTSLAEGRYRWRHDQVLATLAEKLDEERKKKRRKGSNSIQFVRPGQVASKGPKKEDRGILPSAEDWTLSVDLKKQLKFPQEILDTRLRPDLLLVSQKSKQVVMLELTVPWEDRMEEAFGRKKAKYEELVEACQQKKWIASCFPIEVGCRGFAGQSLWRALSSLGIVGESRRKTILAVINTAESASRWLWLKRQESWKTKADY